MFRKMSFPCKLCKVIVCLCLAFGREMGFKKVEKDSFIQGKRERLADLIHLEGSSVPQ